MTFPPAQLTKKIRKSRRRIRKAGKDKVHGVDVESRLKIFMWCKEERRYRQQRKHRELVMRVGCGEKSDVAVRRARTRQSQEAVI